MREGLLRLERKELTNIPGRSAACRSPLGPKAQKSSPIEITRLSKQANSYAYDCERNSQTALAKWIENRRKQARVAIQLDPKILEAYVGQYQFEHPPNRILTVSREDGRLFIDWPRNFKSELFAESESKFFLKVRPFQLVFIKDERQVTHLEFRGDQETVRLKRIK
jgi:hypothetical protein